MSVPRQILSLLAQRCESYHNWELAFRSVLIATKNPKAASDFFQLTTQHVAQKITSVSLTLRNEILPKLQLTSSTTEPSDAALLSRYVELIQRNEKIKFESTVAVQKLIMSHMRGENCSEFVHELNCEVFAFCFGFIGGSSLAAVTASASVLTRRRVARNSHGEGDIDDDDKGDQNKKKKQVEKIKTIQRASIGVSSSSSSTSDIDDEQLDTQQKPVDPCDVASSTLLNLLSKIKEAEEAISETAQEIQAMVSDEPAV